MESPQVISSQSPQVISSQAWAESPASILPIPPQLTSTEGDRIVWSLRGYGDMQIHCTIHLQGRVVPERLARAVRLSMDAEPILGCSYQPRWWRSLWHRRTDLETLPLCTMEETEDLEASLQAFLTTNFDPTQDPLVHVRIFRQEHDTICVKVSHVIADAAGTKQYVYLLSSLYNQLAQTPNLTVTPQLTGSRSMWQLISQLGWRGLVRAVKRGIPDTYHRLFPMRYWNVPTQKGPRTQQMYVFQHIEPEQFQAMKYFTRQHNATLNDLVMSAYLRALDAVFEIPSSVPVRTFNTVDLRRYMPNRQLDRICNFSTFSHPIFRREKGETLVQTVNKMRDHMNRLKSNMIGVGDIHSMAFILNVLPASWYQHLAHFFFQYLYSIIPPTITNMGRIDPSQVNFDDCPIDKAYLTASIMYPPIFVSGCSGFDESITLSAGFCETSISSQTVQEIFTQTVRELPS